MSNEQSPNEILRQIRPRSRVGGSSADKPWSLRYVDHEELDRKRHLLRLWLSLPDAQPLPASWKSACKDVDARAVRGGFRGANITPEVESFEQRMAAHHQMQFRVYLS